MSIERSELDAGICQEPEGTVFAYIATNILTSPRLDELDSNVFGNARCHEPDDEPRGIQIEFGHPRSFRSRDGREPAQVLLALFFIDDSNSSGDCLDFVAGDAKLEKELLTLGI